MNAPTALASVEHCEALRQHALEPDRTCSAEPLGAILVVKRGVAGWMRRWGEVGGTPAPPQSPLPLACPLDCDTPGWRHELAVLLAANDRSPASISCHLMNAESKINAEHLQRAAYLYIRQSSLHQVLENTESTERQYALRRRAVVLGWSQDKIVVIDHDQGQSGASAADRAGFQRLVAEVGLGKAGIVMGLPGAKARWAISPLWPSKTNLLKTTSQLPNLVSTFSRQALEVSRLARNCADWHRLLEICALTHTLILDEDGLYDPSYYNDRLLLGLKGTMSEAELHVLKARLVGGVLNKARRGELNLPLPVGLVYDENERVQLDPDQQVQQTLRTFFATFARVGTAWGVVQAFRREGLKFPRRSPAGSGEIRWEELTYSLALHTLHNPRYAGIFCFGRRRSWRSADGRQHWRALPRDQWRFVKKNAHAGYISWDDFVTNEQRLAHNHQAHGGNASKAGPPREGPALLQGLVICGKCGKTMTVRYHVRGGQLTPDYICQKECVEEAKKVCQCISGGSVDEAVGRYLVEALTPLALEAALKVQEEIQARLTEAARLRRQQVQRAEYEAEKARTRYMRVDPNNRLVADSLEAQWNEKLRVLADTREDCDKQERLDSARLTQEQKTRIRALAGEFPKLWSDPKTQHRDRKRMARLLIEDVTLRRDQDCLVQLRFKGGATHEMRLPLAKTAAQMRKTSAEVVARIDSLLEAHSESDVATILDQKGWRSGEGNEFALSAVRNVRYAYRLKSHCERLHQQGWRTVDELAPNSNAKPLASNTGEAKVLSPPSSPNRRQATFIGSRPVVSLNRSGKDNSDTRISPFRSNSPHEVQYETPSFSLARRGAQCLIAKPDFDPHVFRVGGPAGPAREPPNDAPPLRYF